MVSLSWPGSTDQMCGAAAGGSRIDQLVLVDRVVDLISPMCTQLTYEGLIDETLHIKNGTVTTETAGGGCSGSARQSGLPLLMLPCCAARQAELSPKLLLRCARASACTCSRSHLLEQLARVLPVVAQC